MKTEPVNIRITVIDKYLSFDHKLYSGTELEAVPQYTSTKKLKGYAVKSKVTGADIFMRVNEVDVLPHP